MLEFRLLIGGRLEAGDETLEVVNPATEGLLAKCPRASKAQLDKAVAAALDAFPSWSAKSSAERAAVLVAMAAVLEDNAAELGRLLTLEQGKPLAEAIGEVMGSAAFFRYFASLRPAARSVWNAADDRIEIRRRPLGVVGAIVPWNYPLLLMAFKAPAALLAGNTVVLKPAPTTPLATLRFAELVKDIVPAGVLNVIVDANDLGAAMAMHPDIRKISFTGSTETGRKVMANAAGTLKRISLELGGDDAAIVLEDADPKIAAPRIFAAAFQNAGQVCIAIKRVYVHERIYEAMCDELARLAEAVVVGDGLQPYVEMGPVQNKAQFEKVLALIESARADGKVIAGGERKGRSGYFIHPTIVRDIDDGAKLVDEEQFGPVLPVIRYSDIEDALQRANASVYGLGGSVWGTDPARAWDVATRIESGSVWINKHADIQPYLPFAGAKLSGLGSELGEDALAEFTQIQVLNMAVRGGG